MGLETATLLAIGGVALSGVGMFAQMRMANQQAKAAARAAQANFEFRNQELTRQQAEANRIAREQKGDVIRKADQQLGAIRAVEGEIGASTSSFLRIVSELGGVEGTDLSRIEANRVARVEALQAGKRAAGQDYANVLTAAYNQQQAAITSAVLGFAGSALQIGATAYRDARIEEAIKNRKNA